MFCTSLPFQFNAEDIVQLQLNMKQLFIRLSSLYMSWKKNELVCSSKQPHDTTPFQQMKQKRQPQNQQMINQHRHAI
jgi:hypothetical protein